MYKRQAYTTGNWSPISTWDPYYWVELHKRIRSGLIFLQEAKVLPEKDLTEDVYKRQGVINKQTSFILKDPYANAFYDDDTKYTRWNSDHTEMKPGTVSYTHLCCRPLLVPWCLVRSADCGLG